jgi:hypothetical protein
MRKQIIGIVRPRPQVPRPAKVVAIEARRQARIEAQRPQQRPIRPAA